MQHSYCNICMYVCISIWVDVTVAKLQLNSIEAYECTTLHSTTYYCLMPDWLPLSIIWQKNCIYTKVRKGSLGDLKVTNCFHVHTFIYLWNLLLFFFVQYFAWKNNKLGELFILELNLFQYNFNTERKFDKNNIIRIIFYKNVSG